MREIYSKIKPDVLLHIVNHCDEIDDRCDMCLPEEFLQVASFKLPKDKMFRPHKHVKKLAAHNITQELWVIIRGSVEAILYDLDDTILGKTILKPGDCSITLRGGHNYRCLEDDTLVYEVKTGPYLGIKSDKEFIE